MLNERAREILGYIRSFQREKGYPPTIREIGEAFEISSTNGVRYHLNILEKGGHLSRRSRISRGTTSVSEGIPVLGRVAAGQPILAEASYESSIEPGTVFGSTAGLFALKVRGDSMTGGAGIDMEAPARRLLHLAPFPRSRSRCSRARRRVRPDDVGVVHVGAPSGG